MLSLEDATLKWAASRCQISQIEKRLADCSRMLFEAQAGASATELRKRLQLANQQLAVSSDDRQHRLYLPVLNYPPVNDPESRFWNVSSR